MQCRICNNVDKNIILAIREMQHGLKKYFNYFQCNACGCIQIKDIPDDMSPYYPSDYYSFNSEEGNEFLVESIGFFKRQQVDYLTGNRNNILGSIFSIGYDTPRLYHWISMMRLKKNHRILDIGCGTGVTLKRMYQLGFKNLTGVDPFIRQNYTFSGSFHIYKMDPLNISESEKYDCVMMHHSFEHMVFEEDVLHKVKSILKPEGKILIRIPVVSTQLMDLYQTDLVSLDAPRHIYIHTPASMDILCKKAGLKTDLVEYDAEPFSFWASEQYQKDIPLSDKRSYGNNRKASGFSKMQIRQFKKKIARMNAEGTSDTAAFYISEDKS